MIPLTYALELLDELRRLPDGPDGPVVPATGCRMYRFDGPVRMDLLRAAVDDVVARHDALRTVPVDTPDGRYLRVLPPLPGRLLIGSDQHGQLDLAEPPLLHIQVEPDPTGRGALLTLTAHRTVADPWSLALLARDLVGAYRLRLCGGPPLSDQVMQYAEIAADDRSERWLRRIEQLLPRWRFRLAGVERLGLPVMAGLPGPVRTTRFALPAVLWRSINSTARLYQTTPFNMLMTAFTATMYPDGCTDEALVPVHTPGRQASEWETVGFLFNVLPLRIKLAGAAGPVELLRRVDAACQRAYADQIPLAPILAAVPELLPALTSRYRPVPQFRFLTPLPVDPAVPDGPADWTLTPLVDQNPPVLPAPLLWTMRQDGGSDADVVGEVRYDASLFPPAQVAWRIETFQDFLGRLVAGKAAQRYMPVRS